MKRYSYINGEKWSSLGCFSKYENIMGDGNGTEKNLTFDSRPSSLSSYTIFNAFWGKKSDDNFEVEFNECKEMVNNVVTCNDETRSRCYLNALWKKDIFTPTN